MDRLRARREFNNDNIVRWWNTTIAVGVVRIAWSERERKEKVSSRKRAARKAKVVVTESFVSREPQLVSFFPRRLGL